MLAATQANLLLLRRYSQPLESDAHFLRSDRLASQPLVTAIIPTRNRPDAVVKAVRSALSQSYRKIEVIVVIDGEDPMTRDRLNAIGDPRLRVIDLAVNVGGSEARNIGIRAAHGAWIALLDDDDEWHPGKIVLQITAALSANASLPVISSRLLVRNSSSEFLWPRSLYQTGQSVSDYLYCRKSIMDPGNVIQTSTLLMPKKLMLETPFRKGLKMHQDCDWLLRAARRPDVKIFMLPEASTVYNVDETGTSVGRTVDWEFSTSWAREMREYFSPQAYSSFLGAECMWRAVRSRAGLHAYWQIAREFLTKGRPSFNSSLALVISAFAQGVIPVRLRKIARVLSAARMRAGRPATMRLAGTIAGKTIPTE
jgi:glycosyltransferase involved in cell wall biosynthesis